MKRMQKLAAVVVVIALAGCQQGREGATQRSAEPAPKVSPAATLPASPDSAATAAPPADPAIAQSIVSLRNTVLSAAQFSDPIAREAYTKAVDVTDRLDQLYCYCQCSRNERLRHKSLLTCYQTDHAAECTICQREALQAWSDWKQGIPLEATKKAIDLAYADMAPMQGHGM